jgi:hypothetical protein
MKSRYSLLCAIAVWGTAVGVALGAGTQPGPSTPDSPQVPKESKSSLDGKKWPGGDTTGSLQAEASAGTSDDDPFKRMDTDADGAISPAEFSSSDSGAVARVADGRRRGTRTDDGGFDLRNNEGRPDQSQLFRQLDADKSGSLSREEWSASDRARSTPTRQ